ncbi:heterokaryon incompatibility protein Het-C-domain-containing protein [Flammula alnicola]|nr:heterokaryon incompatibility protein Het-C-domain-containing protein [Flammula alnicola]
MGFTPNLTNTFLLLTILVVLLPVETYAFGAGDIPDFAYLNEKAFRHGDIENVLETLVKSAGGAAIGGSGLFGFASSVIKQVSGGSKFSKSDVKKVYFGNWLRDYSQAMDIAGLSKLTADTLVLIVAVLGFMTFGFATGEFEVTADRLGVYLPVEHIDNPKGYAEKEGDARSVYPKLRPPVSPRELEIDERTGMKKYIATENQGWDTSTAFIRRTFRACIEAGRRARGKEEGADLWESYRLLGQGLHTLEDLLAHSNWCELTLRKLGYEEVFCHVGDRVIINTPSGPAPPLVTGTFGSADFMHSLLGEAGDKLSQASVTDLSAKMNNTSQGGSTPDISVLKNILGKFGGGDDKLNKGEEMKKQSQAYHFDPDNIAPPEVQKQLFGLLKWHDDILKDITQGIEMVPGLENLLDEFSNALNAYIYTILAPYLGPILTQATGVLNEGSAAVIDTDDQYQVFDNPNAHDPSHSILSKDHFGLILNEPAGKIAQIVVENSVNLIVRAWSDNSNPDEIITEILEAFHHPFYATGRSEIQRKMLDGMQRWIGGLGSEATEIINSLTKESVRNHQNKRHGLDDTEEPGYGGCGHGYTTTSKTAAGGYAASKPTQSYGRSDDTSTYGENNQKSSSYSSQRTSDAYSRTDSDTYGQGRTTGGYSSRRRDDEERKEHDGGYASQRRDDNTGYGYDQRRSEIPSYDRQGRDDNPAYGGERRDETPAYGRQRRDANTEYGYDQSRSSEIPSDENPAYGGERRDETSAYGRQRRDDGNTGYGGEGYRNNEDDSRGYSRAHGGQAQSGYEAQPTGYAPSYAQPDESSYSGNRFSEDNNDSSRRYGRNVSRDEDEVEVNPSRRGYGGGEGGYGGAGGDNTSYGRSEEGDSYNDGRNRHGRHGGRGDDAGEEPSYGQSGYGQAAYDQTASTGYAPSYEGQDDTFGAERLNIGDGEEESYGDSRRHHKHRGEDY